MNRIFLPIAIVALTGCVMIGTGERTVVRATGSGELAREFPALVTDDPNDASRIVHIKSNGSVGQGWTSPSSRMDDFEDYLRSKYGRSDFEAAKLDISFRDLGRMPPLAPELQAKVRQELIKVMNDPKLSLEQRQQRAQELKASLLNAPDSERSTTLFGYSNGTEIYHYFPRLEIDLSADLRAASMRDRFSLIVLRVRLPKHASDAGVRFLDLAPKDADIVEFTRGQLKQSQALEAKAEAGRSTQGVGTRAGGADVSTRGLNLGASLAYSISDTLTQELRDALERRTVAVVDGGRTLVIQLRAIRNKRIGGTYSFDLMLEIPSEAVNLCPDGDERCENPIRYMLEPVVREIKPDVDILAVVRHVRDRGLTGVFYRVPETENDDVFEQVVSHSSSDRTLWTFGNAPWVRSHLYEKKVYAISVTTNREDAQIVAVDRAGRVLAAGQGRRARLEVTTTDWEDPREVEVRFLPVVHVGEKGKTILSANPRSISLTVPGGESGASSHYTAYER